MRPTIGHMNFDHLELLKSEALVFVVAMNHIHFFRIQQLFANNNNKIKNKKSRETKNDSHMKDWKREEEKGIG